MVNFELYFENSIASDGKMKLSQLKKKSTVILSLFLSVTAIFNVLLWATFIEAHMSWHANRVQIRNIAEAQNDFSKGQENTSPTYRYWLTYVDVIHHGSSETWNLISIRAFEESTFVRVDSDSFYLYYPGEAIQINYPDFHEGSCITSDKPITISYCFLAANNGIYEDGRLDYSLLEESFWGTDYWIPTSNTEVSVLACQDNTVIEVLGSYYALSGGETKRFLSLPPGTHIISDRPISVVIANYSSDHYSNTFAYTLFPKNRLDTLYYSPHEHPYNLNSPTSRSAVHLLAVHSATIATIDTMTYVLSVGDTASYFTLSEAAIRSNNPIYAIYVCDIYARDPWSGTYRDYTYAFPLVPSKLAGKEFVIGSSARYSHGFPGIEECITSVEDSNIVTLSTYGVPRMVDTLDRGERLYLHEEEVPGWRDSSLWIESTRLTEVTSTIRHWWNNVSESASGICIFGKSYSNAESESFTFYPGIPPPFQKEVPIDASVQGSFTRPINPGTLNDTTCFVTSLKSGLIMVEKQYYESTYSLELIPNSLLPPEDIITVTLTNGIKDLNGDSLEDTTWSFVTGPGVYPGDANNDGVVNEVDVLPLGIFWSWTDLARDSLGIDWTIKPVKQPWSDRAATYADANGDGVIDLKDLVAISANWGKIHPYAHPTLAPEALDSLAEHNPDAFKELYQGLKDKGSESGDRIREILETVMNSDQTPERFTLFQNHPNPFNPETEISYFLLQGAEVELIIYNVLGEKVKTLADGFENAGMKRVRWDGTDDEGQSVASGIYFYRIKVGEYTLFKKMVLLR
jgi:hypothetical protein